jgi:cytochrome P450
MTSPLAAASFDRDPYPLYAALRKRGRLVPDETPRLWAACTARAVEQALSHPALRVRPQDEPVPRALEGTHAGRLFGALMRMNDGPAHAAAKPRASAVLTGWLGDAMHAAALEVADVLPDAAALDEAMFDAPLAVVAHLLGVSPTERDQVVHEARAVVAGWSPAAGAAQRRAAQPAAHALLERFGDANRVGLLTQACEATAALIGQTLVALRRDPALWSAVDDALLLEVARHDAPVQNTRRFVAEPVTLCDQPLQRGDTVLVLLASANRDETRYADAQCFDAHRFEDPAAAPPLTWGAGGHACPGARLSRGIALALIRAWGERGSDLSSLSRRWTYLPAPNLRLPRFAVTEHP